MPNEHKSKKNTRANQKREQPNTDKASGHKLRHVFKGADTSRIETSLKLDVFLERAPVPYLL